jgi:helix-turn-helix protein
MRESLAAMPTLPHLPPEVLDGLPLRALVDLRRNLQHLAADVEATLAHRLAESPVVAATALSSPPEIRADDIRAYTTGEFASRLGKSAAYVRDLCRSGRLPGASRRGRKEWFIPVAVAHAWLTADGVDDVGSLTLPSQCDLERGQASPEVSRPVTVRIRVAARRSRGHGQKVGDGETRHA